MESRSYGQIQWRQGQLGLLMVNQHQQQFFLFAEPLVMMLENPGKYILVKRRDRKPEKAIAYHGGEICGAFENSGENCQISLFFGPLEANIHCDQKRRKALNVIDIQKYSFPKTELDHFKSSIDHMLDQKDLFNRFLREAQTMPGPFPGF